MIRISASVLGADLLRLGEEIETAERSGVQWLHLDHMDGHFTPNISFGPDFVRAIRKKTDLFLDVHLMFTNPMEYIDVYCRAGSDMITVHAEADDDPLRVINRIRMNGKKAGISINPHTPPEKISKLLPVVDHVLVMTVEPGFGGQSFMADMMPKVTAIKQEIDRLGLNVSIQVDGGINATTAIQAAQAGADNAVMGSALFNAADPAALVASVHAL